MDRAAESRAPSIVDLDAEVAKKRCFVAGPTRRRRSEREASLAWRVYRDGRTLGDQGFG